MKYIITKMIVREDPTEPLVETEAETSEIDYTNERIEYVRNFCRQFIYDRINRSGQMWPKAMEPIDADRYMEHREYPNGITVTDHDVLI